MTKHSKGYMTIPHSLDPGSVLLCSAFWDEVLTGKSELVPARYQASWKPASPPEMQRPCMS